MKKYLLLIPLFLFAMMAKAADHRIGSATRNILGTTVANAANGDVIILTDNGPYFNVYAAEGGDDYTNLNKNLTIKADDGVNPVIKYEVSFRITNAANVKFLGIKFDGSSLSSNYDNYFHFNDNTNNSVEFENCEFTNMGKYMLYVKSGKKAASCIFKNCNIHDNTQRIFYNVKATTNKLAIINTEISNCSHYIIHNNNDGGTAQMDSCIIMNSNLHNNSRRAVLNEGTITALKIKDSEFSYFTSEVVIDNYTSSSIEKLEILGSEFHHNSNKVLNITGSSINELKVDGCTFRNNSNYIIDGATSSHTGSCKINNSYFHHNHKCAVYFEKSSSSENQTCDEFELTNSTIANNDSLTDYLSQIYIRSYNDALTDAIKVKIDHCTFYNNPTLNYDHANIRLYQLSDVTISNCIFAHPYPGVDIPEGAQNARYAAITYGGTITNCLTYNYKKNSSGLTGATNYVNNKVDDPLFSDAANGDFSYPNNWVTMSLSPACGTATDGTDLGDPRWARSSIIPSTNFATPYNFASDKAQLIGEIQLNANNHIEYIDTKTKGSATWKIHVTTAGAVQATIDLEAGSVSGNKFRIYAYNSEGVAVDSIVAPYNEASDADINVQGTMYFPAEDDYSIRLYNAQEWSHARVEKIILSHAGGAVQSIPATLTVDEAWYGNGGTRANDQIYFSSWKTADSWIKWNVATSNDLYCNVKVNISTTNAHQIAFRIVEEGKTDTIKFSEAYSSEKGDPVGSPFDINLGKLYLIGGKKYVVVVTNPVSGSAAKINSVKIQEIAAPIVNVPANTSLLPADAMLSSKAGIVDGKIDFVSTGESRKYNPNEWARWKINVTEDNAYIFTANVTSTTGQRYIISILNSDESVVIGEKEEPSDIGSGDKTQATNPIVLYEGEYIVKIVNPYEYSDGGVKSISISTASSITIADTETDEDAVIGDNDGKILNAQLTRAFTGGMYNTICLPFDVLAAELARVFPGARVKELTSSSIESDGYILNLNFTNVNSLEAGVPYLIWPAGDVENPTFLGVTIDNNLNPSVTTNADFIGNFVADEVPEGEDNFFLGAENKLYYSTSATAIKGMRAYFHVKSGNSSAPMRARIIDNENVVTDIEIIGNSLPEPLSNNVRKVIENGQLLIIKDGAQFNALGVRVK